MNKIAVRQMPCARSMNHNQSPRYSSVERVVLWVIEWQCRNEVGFTMPLAASYYPWIISNLHFYIGIIIVVYYFYYHR
jgi:hypothetical protein